MAASKPRAAADTGAIENIELLDVDGAPVRLGSLWEDGPVVLVWLRHYGRTHCRHYAVQWNRAHEEIEAKGARIVLIGQGTPKHAAHFKPRYAPELPVLADESRETYKAMGIPRGSAMQLIGPKSVLKGIARSAQGQPQGRIIGDAAQLGATFIVMPSGEVAWSHISSDASDNPSVEEVLEALQATVA